MKGARASWFSGSHPDGGQLAPAYYWAGNGSKLIHSKKGFGRPLDVDAYDRAYSEERLRWLRDEAGVNFLFLTYNWGLPPEIERHDWEVFGQTTRIAHELGMGTAAYIQVSNAAVVGSYAPKDWYAERPNGARVPFYLGRHFTCLHSPEWRAAVAERVRDTIARGADAVFLDNCTFGAMPVPLASDYTGFAGCACARCRDSFARWQAEGGLQPQPIPGRFRPGRDPVSASYSDWRATTLTDFLRMLRRTITEIDPSVPMLTNTVGAVNVNTYHLFGVDLPALAGVVDWLFVENLQAPRADERRLVHNAGTFKLLQALKPGAPALSISYDKGIGVDSVPAPAVFARTMAEGYAAGGIPVLRATEYIEHGTWTLLQPGTHDAHAAASREVIAFVADHPELFEGRRPTPSVAVVAPISGGWRGDVYPEHGADFLAAIQALIGAGIPFRVVGEPPAEQLLEGIELLLQPLGARPPPGYAGRTLDFAALGLRKPRRSLLVWFVGPLEPLVARIGPLAVDGYFTRSYVRHFTDRLDIFVRLVFKDRYRRRPIAGAALDQLRAAARCSVEAPQPVLADVWETDGGLQLHLVNYGDTPVVVRLLGRLGAPTRIVDLDARRRGRGSRRHQALQAPETFELRRYAVVEWAAGGEL